MSDREALIRKRVEDKIKADAIRALGPSAARYFDSPGGPTEFRCSVCEAFIHPLLVRCAFCGTRQIVDLSQIATRSRNSTGRVDMFSTPLEQTTFRYEGGLPGVPSGIDVRLRIRSGLLEVLEASSGGTMMSAPVDHVLAAQVFADSTPLTRGWFGIATESVILLQQPAVAGGRLVVAQSIQGEIRQWAVGNRSGLFVRRADHEGYLMMLDALVMAASEMLVRSLQRGHAYERELGLLKDSD